ncbi:hypothetical protein [Coleofasciculus sp. FACHB-1120]|uniref:hypothetical protein n=1 Tax=Coleofasciculus sp. FACHB-1120 TaxID=2692783 RepID=UPI001683A90E|nr:hypothetical protein [Coleofasciculus sp. FACHB-1120]MBD2742346.1 hypothetical protein [Coleofasciculus sp. FACHB-1120]
MNRCVYAIQGRLLLPTAQLVNIIINQAIAIQELQASLKIIATLTAPVSLIILWSKF